ncbi:unnamed protein product [Linum trigynum]|uniref:FBD domain-containing protein n=1 Tax=Linum trigynum TaxID=586398 RepID=A0AAV2EII1_9ROSI
MRGADRISGLPGSVMDHILTFLPLREAARTSVLSREWRNRWVDMPALALDDKFGKVVEPVSGGASPELASAANCKLMLDVFEVLSRHRGHLKEFSLSIPGLRSSFRDHQIDTIINFLDRQHVESLAIGIKDYVLPRLVYSFTRLRKLNLCGCKLTSSNVAFDSAAFDSAVFAELDVLELRDLAVPQVGEACFSFNCPLLSALTMEGCGHRTNKIIIVIEAPRLEYFRLVGSFSLLEFKHTPLLKTVDIHRDFSINIQDKGYSNLLNFTAGLPAVEHLSISGHIYNYLKIGSKYAAKCSWWQRLLNLKNLRLNAVSLGSSATAYVWCAFSLMNISAGLTELTIDIAKQQESDPAEQIVKVISMSRGMYSKLKRVKVNQFCGTRLEMAFIQRLLTVSPALDKMEIELSDRCGDEDQRSVFKKLLELTRASTTAQIWIK